MAFPSLTWHFAIRIPTYVLAMAQIRQEAWHVDQPVSWQGFDLTTRGTVQATASVYLGSKKMRNRRSGLIIILGL